MPTLSVRRWPGAVVAIEYRGETLVRPYGFADLELKVPVTAETVFRMGSVTKQYTAALILRLQELGKLSVGDQLGHYLPEFPKRWHGLTLHQLLTHTSGLQNHSQQPEFLRRRAEAMPREALLALFQDLPPRFAPGTDHEYCNSGYYLLGLVAEVANDTSYRAALSEHLFTPLGLKQTFAMYDSPIPNRAKGYSWNGRDWENAAPLNMRLPGGGGALGATAQDLLKWQQALNEGTLLSPSSLSAMRSPTEIFGGETVRYGYGVGLAVMQGLEKITHSGGINGFTSVLSTYPERSLTIGILANAEYSNPAAMGSELARLVLNLPAPEYATLELAAHELDAVAGAYLMRGEALSVTVSDGMIWCMGEPYFAIGHDTFIAQDDVERQLTFKLEGGRATRMTIMREGDAYSGSRPATEN